MKKRYIILPIGLLFIAQNLNCEIKTAKPEIIKVSQANTATSDSLIVKTVSGRDILTGSEEGKKLELELTQKRSKIEAEGQRMEQELKSDVTKIQNDFKAKLKSESALERDQDALMRKEKDFKAKIEALQEEFGRVVNRDLAKFNAKINSKVMEVAKQNGWDLVILKESGEIIYASSKVDATNEIIALLNQGYAKTTASKEVVAPKA